MGSCCQKDTRAEKKPAIKAEDVDLAVYQSPQDLEKIKMIQETVRNKEARKEELRKEKEQRAIEREQRKQEKEKNKAKQNTSR